MADQRDDPIAAANQHISDYFQAIGGRAQTPEQRAEYQQLVERWRAAVADRDQPLAA